MVRLSPTPPNAPFILFDTSPFSKGSVIAQSFPFLQEVSSNLFEENIAPDHFNDKLLYYISSISIKRVEELLRFWGRKQNSTYTVIVNLQKKADVSTLIQLGCNHFLFEETKTIEDWIDELKQAMSFPSYLPLDYQKYYLDHVQHAYLEQLHEQQADCNQLWDKLSKREIMILSKLIEGKSNKQIAHDCHLAVSTIRDHISELLRKLEANNRTHLIRKSVDIGLLHPPLVLGQSPATTLLVHS
ncbi:LuxR C-terminal-related transcriptional regulator [Bacillus piscicola]|uniref:LuxR C-terminal-related transcriptional regulator n=1 Tax=Bacillus piscicola TaxID=1632684 RepID=UPI001F09BE21|nr:LuxR C-terminal-related transcriptional regulator [Bacillus piscicola]